MLSIIIVSYNSASVLIKSLDSLISSNRYPVIIVDNASKDNSAALLKSRFPVATIKALPQNIGYGRAANIGLQTANTPYALLLNPDLSASIEDIQRLSDYSSKDPETALWGPASRKNDFTKEPPVSVDWISGCAMFFDLKKLSNVGFFDENIFLFFEETDLCKRIRDAGYQIKLCRDIYFDHDSGHACEPSPAVEQLKNWHYGWSRCYYFNKHDPLNRKRTPQKQHAQYRRKSLTALASQKRRKYKAQAQGAKAFLDGEPAFLPDGTPHT